jgi:ribosomal protein L11 methylase PrmA
LRQATKVGGSLILAGIIESREANVMAAFTKRGFHLVTRRSFEDWVSLVMNRSA